MVGTDKNLNFPDRKKWPQNTCPPNISSNISYIFKHLVRCRKQTILILTLLFKLQSISDTWEFFSRWFRVKLFNIRSYKVKCTSYSLARHHNPTTWRSYKVKCILKSLAHRHIPTIHFHKKYIYIVCTQKHTYKLSPWSIHYMYISGYNLYWLRHVVQKYL